jgi:hypothetical protein
MKRRVAETCFGLADSLALLLGYTLLVGLLVLLPLALLRRTRPIGGMLLVVTSPHSSSVPTPGCSLLE